MTTAYQATQENRPADDGAANGRSAPIPDAGALGDAIMVARNGLAELAHIVAALRESPDPMVAFAGQGIDREFFGGVDEMLRTLSSLSCHFAAVSVDAGPALLRHRETDRDVPF